MSNLSPPMTEAPESQVDFVTESVSQAHWEALGPALFGLHHAGAWKEPEGEAPTGTQDS